MFLCKYNVSDSITMHGYAMNHSAIARKKVCYWPRSQVGDTNRSNHEAHAFSLGSKISFANVEVRQVT